MCLNFDWLCLCLSFSWFHFKNMSQALHKFVENFIKFYKFVNVLWRLIFKRGIMKNTYNIDYILIKEKIIYPHTLSSSFDSFTSNWFVNVCHTFASFSYNYVLTSFPLELVSLWEILLLNSSNRYLFHLSKHCLANKFEFLRHTI